MGRFIYVVTCSRRLMDQIRHNSRALLLSNHQQIAPLLRKTSENPLLLKLLELAGAVRTAKDDTQQTCSEKVLPLVPQSKVVLPLEASITVNQTCSA